MARNFSNIRYDTFVQAWAAAERRNAGQEFPPFFVAPHWARDARKSWRVVTAHFFGLRWKRDRCGLARATFAKGSEEPGRNAWVQVEY